jgi:exopolysaccharide production protein ExoY
MHFIGPRPLLSADDDKLATAAQIPNFSLYRSLTRPGLIPPTVLIGRQSAHDEDRAALDLYYLQNWSPLLDLKLVCFAIPAVLLGWGAK